MQITLSWQTVVGLAGGIAALIALLGYLFKGYDFVQRQRKQDELIKSIREEQQLLTVGVLALRAVFDTSLKNAEDVKSRLGLATLGLVSDHNAEADGSKKRYGYGYGYHRHTKDTKAKG